MPHRFGPILLGPPLVKSWQVWHFFAVAWPAATSALAIRPETGSVKGGELGAAEAGAAVSAISPWGFTSSSATKPVTMETKPPSRMAPTILFSSNDAIIRNPVVRIPAPSRAAAECNGFTPGCPMDEPPHFLVFPASSGGYLALPEGSRRGAFQQRGNMSRPSPSGRRRRQGIPQRPLMNPLVVIPARLAATRLPGKPLADIHGQPMIVHVWRRAMAAGVGPVLVAAQEPEIARAIETAGGRARLTRADHPSGSDRVFEAVEAVDPQGRHDVVINLQGDLPTLDPTLL